MNDLLPRFFFMPREDRSNEIRSFKREKVPYKRNEKRLMSFPGTFWSAPKHPSYRYSNRHLQ